MDNQPLATQTVEAIGRGTPVDDLPLLLRVSEAAAWLDCSAGTVREMIRTGQLPERRLGRLVRVPRSALAAFASGEGGAR